MHINYLAVGLCSLINMILGGLWYSPVLFGERWAQLMGLDFAKMKNDPTVQKTAQRGYLIASVCHILMALVMAHMIQYTHATSSWTDGLKVGMLCWLGFTLTTMLPNHVFTTSNFSWTLAAINIGYPMVGLSTAGAILAAWR